MSKSVYVVYQNRTPISEHRTKQEARTALFDLVDNRDNIAPGTTADTIIFKDGHKAFWLRYDKESSPLR